MNKDTNFIYQSVLYSLLNFELLDYLEGKVEEGEESAKQLINGFFERKRSDYVQVKPLVRLPTTLGLLSATIFFLKNNTEGLTIKSDLIFKKNDVKQENVKPSEILQTIRNAIAHWPDSHNEADSQTSVLANETTITFISFSRDKKNKFSCSFKIPDDFHQFVIEVIICSRSVIAYKLNSDT